MGSKQIKTEDSMVLDQLLYDTFKNTKLEFPIKEITKMKLRFKDSSFYFDNQFDYFIFFNNYVFHEGLNILYDNFISKIEKFSKSKKGVFRLLIDFDDETEALSEGYEMEFEPLFTIVFERLELDSVLYFALINCNQDYLSQFFTQLYECIYVYKNNKKFDPLYFLLPNTDYLIKNECAIVYLANISNNKIEELYSSYTHQMEFQTKYNEIIFNSLYFAQFVKIMNSIHSETKANELFYTFIQKNCKYLAFLKTVLFIDFNKELSEFLMNCDKLLLILDLIINSTTYNQIIFSTQKDIDIENNQNIEMLIKKMIYTQEKSIQKQSYQHIKILTINKMENNESKQINERIESNGSNEVKETKEKPLMWKMNKIENLIYSLITDSYAYGSKDQMKLRKIVIDYCEVYVKEDLDINQKKLNESVENLVKKNKKVYLYKNEQLTYTWFLSLKQISCLKANFAFIAKKKLKGINEKEIIKNIFDYWFTKPYFLSNKNESNGFLTQSQFELEFYA